MEEKTKNLIIGIMIGASIALFIGYFLGHIEYKNKAYDEYWKFQEYCTQYNNDQFKFTFLNKQQGISNPNNLFINCARANVGMWFLYPQKNDRIAYQDITIIPGNSDKPIIVQKGSISLENSSSTILEPANITAIPLDVHGSPQRDPMRFSKK